MRYKQRSAQRITSFLRTLALVSVCVVVGFWFGKQYGAEQVIILEESLESVKQERDDLQTQITEERAAAQTANKRFEQLQEEVQSILPKGPMQDLVTILREQLAKGTDPERLSFVIRSARPPTGCVEPETKRFVVSTPVNTGPKSVIQVADGVVKITGEGVPARNENDSPEAWYDPAKKVTVYFTKGDQTESKEGVLPIRHSVIAEGREYRFSIEQGARSFAKVVFDSCEYP
jgi:hypothetical protein